MRLNEARRRGQAGFSLIELLLVLAGIVTLSAFAVPSFSNLVEATRARDAGRTVERQLQTARMKAVTHSRALRVRFNCPVAGQFRMLEVTGVAATDNAGNRCSPTAFPFPGPRDTLRSTPSLDSAVIYLPTGTTVAGAFTHLEFGTKGQVYTVDGSGNVASVVGTLVLTVTYKGRSNTVTVNALGRVRFN
jgi:prepilin-type N-terminal cleavage/methylation domain-containing protein